MSVSVTIRQAASQYGLGNIAYTPSALNAVSALLGPTSSVTTGWGASGPAIGVPTSITVQTANGFGVEISLTYADRTAGTVTAVRYFRADTGEALISGSGAASFTVATLAEDVAGARLFAGADTLIGNGLNNTVQGGAGDDRIDGGPGTDTAVFQGLSTQYQWTRVGDTTTVTGPDGHDILLSVERLQFDNGTLAFDTDGTAGQAYRLYQAAFDRRPDAPGLGYQTHALDSGLTLKEVARHFLASPEFSATYGGLSDAEFVTQLYQNVLDRGPDPAGLNHHLADLANGMERAQLLVNFSESPENQAKVIGDIAYGMGYQ